MMKIALVSSYTLPFYCGNSILVERLRGGLTKRGYDVAIFNAGLTEAQVKEIMNNGLSAVVNAAVDPAGKLTTTWANIK